MEKEKSILIRAVKMQNLAIISLYPLLEDNNEKERENIEKTIEIQEKRKIALERLLLELERRL